MSTSIRQHLYYNNQLVDASLVPQWVFEAPYLSPAGLYTTLPCYRGEPWRLCDHLCRLRSTAGVVASDLLSEELLRPVIDNLVVLNGVQQHGKIRISLILSYEDPPKLVVTVEPLDADALRARRREGVDLRASPWLRMSGDRNFTRKRLGLTYLTGPPNPAWLFSNVLGNICESLYGNVFFVQQGRLITPPLGAPCLPGLTRETVLILAKEEGIAAAVAHVPALDVVAASSEIFITSSLGGIVPVISLDDQPVDGGEAGPVTRGLQDALARHNRFYE